MATPLITSNDGEGAGETFFLTTNDNEDFFGQKVNLTVTGQLHKHLEIFIHLVQLLELKNHILPVMLQNFE